MAEIGFVLARGLLCPSGQPCEGQADCDAAGYQQANETGCDHDGVTQPADHVTSLSPGDPQDDQS